jgi:hypothetical protein
LNPNADHEISIDLVAGIHAIPNIPGPGVMRVGQTVRFSSPGNSFRVEFPNGSPFTEKGQPMAQITDSDVKTLQVAGNFQSRCFITVGSTEVGWAPGKMPESGGVHNVGH